MSLRYRGLLKTVPGRVTVLAPIPSDLLARAERIAEERGVDRAIVLGDLVAQELPDALAEAARERLAPHLPLDAEMPPALTDGISSESSHQHAECSLPAARRQPKHQVDGRGPDA